jgi:hypothetical protein
MKFPTTILTLLLAGCSICANAEDVQLPNTSGGDEPRTGTSVGSATTTGGDYDDSGSGEADDGEARHRTRMVLPVVATASSSSEAAKEDHQEDHPLHLHRFHRPGMAGGSNDKHVQEEADAIAREVPPLPLTGDEEESPSNIVSTSSTGTGAATTTSREEEARRNIEENGASGIPTNGNAKESKRMWGAAAAATATTIGEGTSAEASAAAAASTSTGSSSATMSSSSSAPTTPQHPLDDSNHNQTHRAFVVPKSKVVKSPPDGYELSARVYIDPRDKLAHFDPTPQRIPFWDCGYSGSTTSPLPLKSAYFRHALTGATSWSGTDGKHAVLVVTLSPIAMDLNSGETREFHAGSVILLEDVLIAGHKMRPLANSREGVSVLFLTLPHQFVHTGRDHISLPASFLKPAHRDDPCPDEHAPGDSSGASSLLKNETDRLPAGDAEDEASAVSSLDLMLKSSGTGLSFLIPRKVRRGLLAVFGLSLSSLVADFLAKTAPLWLAVGVGGTCFVAAGTWAMAVGGDALWMAFELQLERRRLGATSVDANLILEEDAESAGARL